MSDLDKYKVHRIEKIVDYLSYELKILESNQIDKLLRPILIDIAFLCPYELETAEEQYLLSEKSKQVKALDKSEKLKLQNSLIEKFRYSTGDNSHPSHRMYRLIYMLTLVEEKHRLGDQLDTLFLVIDDCNLSLFKVEKLIKEHISKFNNR